MRFFLAYTLHPGISSMQTEEVTKNGTLKCEIVYKSISYQYLVTIGRASQSNLYIF